MFDPHTHTHKIDTGHSDYDITLSKQTRVDVLLMALFLVIAVLLQCFFVFHCCGNTRPIVRRAFTGPLVPWCYNSATCIIMYHECVCVWAGEWVYMDGCWYQHSLI